MTANKILQFPTKIKQAQSREHSNLPKLQVASKIANTILHSNGLHQDVATWQPSSPHIYHHFCLSHSTIFDCLL